MPIRVSEISGLDKTVVDQHSRAFGLAKNAEKPFRATALAEPFPGKAEGDILVLPRDIRALSQG